MRDRTDRQPVENSSDADGAAPVTSPVDAAACEAWRDPCPTDGIYLFSDDDAPLYMGQTRKLRARLQPHTGATRGSNQASFAFLIAKRDAAAAGFDIARYRAVLEADLAFIPHFDAACALVAGMDVQFVELADAVTRTLFEVYASLALNTVEYNSFETH